MYYQDDFANKQKQIKFNVKEKNYGRKKGKKGKERGRKRI